PIRRARRASAFAYTTLFRSDGSAATSHSETLCDSAGRVRFRLPGKDRMARVDGRTRRAARNLLHSVSAKYLSRSHRHRPRRGARSEEQTSELQSRENIVCRL